MNLICQLPNIVTWSKRAIYELGISGYTSSNWKLLQLRPAARQDIDEEQNTFQREGEIILGGMKHTKIL